MPQSTLHEGNYVEQLEPALTPSISFTATYLTPDFLGLWERESIGLRGTTTVVCDRSEISIGRLISCSYPALTNAPAPNVWYILARDAAASP